VTSIYGLYDKSGQLRYIGKANNPEKRLSSHMRDARRRDTPVYRWIRKNGTPVMHILSQDCTDWRAEERRLIAEARASGHKLLNVAEGGDEPHCDIETRRANGKRLNDRIANDPKFAELREIKRRLMHHFRDPKISDERREIVRGRMRDLAEYNPRLFGAWKNL
jgi:hypothetical protein